MTRTAFVTGAAGFLGRHLVEVLIRDGWEVVAFCRPSDRSDLLPAGVKVTLGDLREPESIRKAVPEGAEVVFHLAGNTTTWSKNREEQFLDNVNGTANVIAAAVSRRVRRLVYTSSISSYGYQPGVRLREGSPPNAESRGDNYGKSKLAAEALVTQAAREGRLSTIILNPVNILGAYDAANWSQQLILPISNGTLAAVPPGSASWISVNDVVQAHLAAVDAGGSGGNVILGGVEASFLEVVNTIEAILGRRPLTRKATPKPIMRLLFAASAIKAVVTRTEPQLSLAKYRRSVGDLLVDDSLARAQLGLQRTPLRTQLQESISWLTEIGMLKPAGGVRHD